MVRILHVITGLNVGGAESMLYKLLAGSSCDFEHCVVSLAEPGPIATRIAGVGVTVHSLRLRAAAPDPRCLWRLVRIAREFSPDIVSGWMYHGNLFASLAKLAVPGGRLLWGIRSSGFPSSYRHRRTHAVIWLGGRLSRHPDAIVYPSNVACAQHARKGYYADRAIVIPNGTDCMEFKPDSRARAEVRAELGLDETHLVIGLVARLHPMKDHPGFLSAAALVARRHPNTRFILAGSGVTADSVLRPLIAELGLQRHVLLLGERGDMPRVTAAFDIACSASAWGEAFSNALGEAMACGIPCVTTDVGDSAYIVEETGIIVPPSTIEALAGGIRQLIFLGADGRRRLGANARRRIEQNFSLPAVVARYEEFYRGQFSLATTQSSRKMERVDPAFRA